MIKVTSIKRLKNGKYELTVDNKKHVVFGDVLLSFNLFKPKEIEDSTLEKILTENDFYEGYNKAIKYINFKMRTEKEVVHKLYEEEISKQNIGRIMDKLKKEGYLNNQKYLELYINDEINLTLNGPGKIALNLRKKGFTDLEINGALALKKDVNWEERAQKIIQKKMKTSSNLSSLKRRIKLSKDLQTLGYSENHYKALMDSLDFDDSKAYEKEKEKLLRSLSKNYEGEKLEYMVKQKLYAKEFRNIE